MPAVIGRNPLSVEELEELHYREVSPRHYTQRHGSSSHHTGDAKSFYAAVMGAAEETVKSGLTEVPRDEETSIEREFKLGSVSIYVPIVGKDTYQVKVMSQGSGVSGSEIVNSSRSKGYVFVCDTEGLRCYVARRSGKINDQIPGERIIKLGTNNDGESTSGLFTRFMVPDLKKLTKNDQSMVDAIAYLFSDS